MKVKWLFFDIGSTLIDEADVYLVKPTTDSIPLYEQMCISHIQRDVDTLRVIIEEKYPEFLKSYDDIIIKGNHFSTCNMLIAKKEIFDEYSKWLFDILFELEKRLVIPSAPYQPRLFGFYSERLLNVFFHQRNYKVKYLPLLIIKEEKNHALLLLLLRNILRNINCWLYKHLR